MTTKTATDINTLVNQILNNTPHGQLTLINGTAIEPLGGWTALSTALDEIARQTPLHLTVCEMGSDTDNNYDPHPLTEAFSQNQNISIYSDANRDQTNPPIDWADPHADFDRPPLPPLPGPFAAYGNPSLTALARHLDQYEPTHGSLPALLIDVTKARPYAEILRRQGQTRDHHEATRNWLTTSTWLADDLKAFAALRPTEPTVIATHDQAVEWEPLTQRAALILPRPQHLHSV